MIRRQAKAACGGHRWPVVVKEELGVLGEGLREEKEEENGSFTLLGVSVACNTRPSRKNLKTIQRLTNPG